MRKPKKKKRTLKINGIIFLIILLVLVITGSYFGYNKYLENKETKNKLALKKEITNHYNEYVKTNKDATIYDSKGNEIGLIGKDIELSLDDFKITYETINFKIKDFEDTYINYQDVDKIDKLKEHNNRYQKYIPFNENIITNDMVSFYNEENKLVYTFNKSYDMPIIIKDNELYGVELNNELLYIKKEDIKEIYEKHNTDLKNSNGVAVLNYHFFYDETDADDAKGCNEGICMSKSQFKTELDLIKDMNMFTVTMKELEMYMDGKLKLPKSVLITIDDGARTKVGVDLLTEYKMNATIFLVTSWYNPSDYYVTDYIELHSHSHNLHNGGKCPGGQGGEIKCLPKDTLLADLKASRESLGGSTAFCYPFYEYNSYSESILKEAGFTMAFIGEINTYYGYKLAEVGADKYKIPRFVMFNYTTISDLRNYFNEIK